MSLPPTDCPRCGKRFLGEPGSLCEECAAEEAEHKPRGKLERILMGQKDGVRS